VRSVTHTLVEHVRAPIDRVFAVLTSPGRIPDWLPGCKAVEVKGPLERGATFNARFGERVTEFEIVDFAPPGTLSWVERGQRKGSKTSFRLDVAGEATAVTIRDMWTPQSLGAWVRGRVLPKRNVQGQLNRMVENLRNLLNQSSTQSPRRDLAP
jgi:carbon monoxide dehydrogenase subunit G